jgi:hypothetical protein
MNIYKSKIESRIEEIEELIYRLEVLNEQKAYTDTLRSTKKELERIIKACSEDDIKLLEEAKRRGFIKGADCTSAGGINFICNEVIVGRKNEGHLFNSSNGFYLEMIFNAESGAWANVNN